MTKKHPAPANSNLDPEKLERFTNWLMQEIVNSTTKSVSVRNVPGYLALTAHEVDEALRTLRGRDMIACSNGRWWMRDTRAHRPALAAAANTGKG